MGDYPVAETLKNLSDTARSLAERARSYSGEDFFSQLKNYRLRLGVVNAGLKMQRPGLLHEGAFGNPGAKNRVGRCRNLLRDRASNELRLSGGFGWAWLYFLRLLTLSSQRVAAHHSAPRWPLLKADHESRRISHS